MNFKQHPLFLSVLLVSALVLAGGAFLAYQAHQGLEAARKKLRATENRVASARSLSPAPTPESVALAEANLAELLATLERQIAMASGSLEDIRQVVPESPNQMYFDLEGFAAELRLAAASVRPLFGEGDPAARMAVPANFGEYAFGFSRFLTGVGGGNPPPRELIPVVHRQKEIVNFLVLRLFEARPLAFLGVKVESAESVLARRSAPPQAPAVTPATPGVGGGRPVGSRGAAPVAARPDEFVVGGQSLRVPGAVETLGFSISFRGYTQNLATFLREIEAARLPLVVRSVSVAPVVEETAPGRGATRTGRGGTDVFEELFGAAEAPAASAPVGASAESPTVAVVSQTAAEFTVVVELVELLVKADLEPLPVATR